MKLATQVTMAAMAAFTTLWPGILVAAMPLVHAQSSEVLMGMPPAQVWFNESSAQFRTGVAKPFIDVTVTYDTSAKLIRVKFVHRVDEGPAAESRSRDFPLSYWPTSIAPLDSLGNFVVAGKTIRGRTRVEEFVLAQPLVIEVGLPGGGSTLVLSEPAMTSVTEVFDEKSVGLDMIPHLIANRGESRRVFIQFWDSKNIYDLDLDSQVYQLAVSPTAGALVVQHMNADFNTCWSFEHLDHGYVYVFFNSNTGMRTAVMDTDKDGDLDYGAHMPPSLWSSMHLNDRTKYVQ